MSNGNVVIIPIQRYNELLDIETRANVAVERIIHGDFVKMEDLLWILGTEMALERAYELKKKREEEAENRRVLAEDISI